MTQAHFYLSGLCPVTGCSGPVAGVSSRMRRAARAFANVQKARDCVIPAQVEKKQVQKHPMIGHNRRPPLLAAE